MIIQTDRRTELIDRKTPGKKYLGMDRQTDRQMDRQTTLSDKQKDKKTFIHTKKG